jgi:MFS family permease
VNEPHQPPKTPWYRLATVDITPLRRHRDLRLLLAWRLVSFFGSMITYTAVPYQLYQLTHSVVVVGALGLVELAGILAFALLGGALADARDRRAMVLVTEAALMATSLALVGNALLRQPQAWLLFLMVGAAAALDSIQRPSLAATIPRLVDREELVATNAVASLTTTAGMIAGPALAGILLAVIGVPATYAVDVATFIVGLACLWFMRAVPPPLDSKPPSLRRVAEGLRYARSRPELIGTYAVDIIAMFFGMPNALFPAIAQGFGGPGVLGLMYSAPAAGAFLFSATSGWTSRVTRHGMGVLVAAMVWGLAIIGFGLVPGLAAALVFLAIAGAADMMSGIYRGTIWNQTIPDSLRGRLASIELLSFSIGPTLGNFESGVVASLFSIRASIVSGGVLCVAGCLLAAVALPAFRAYDARTWKPSSVDA